jgi:hypothetical protein
MNNICPACGKEVVPIKNTEVRTSREKFYCDSKCRATYLRKERNDMWYFNPILESEPTKGGKHSERY